VPGVRSLTTIISVTAIRFNCTGNLPTEEMKMLIHGFGPGKVLFFENIAVKKSDGNALVIPWYIIRVK